MKTPTTMKGLMCQSPAATAVCMPGRPPSVIVPMRKPNGRRLEDETRLINNGHHYISGLVPSVRKMHKEEEEDGRRRLPPSSPFGDRGFQVVVMKVSVHCQGCARKVKKHLSKMEGVTSFSIDIETKRVTVIGQITPRGVLESISRVRRAEFWQS